MSEVSLEADGSGKTSAEHPQMDCEEEADKEQSLSEEAEQESVDDGIAGGGGEGKGDVLYDIDIDSAEENAENGDEDEGLEAGGAAQEASGGTCSDSVGNGGRETAETPEDTATKVIFAFTYLANQPLQAPALVSIFICCGAAGGAAGGGDSIFPI